MLFNNLQTRTKMSNAMHIFTCGNGSWTLYEASGDLLDFNINKFVGNFKVFDIPKTYINVTLSNFIADVAESDLFTSSVTSNKGIFSFLHQVQITTCNICPNRP
jgi:hypothetical protein